MLEAHPSTQDIARSNQVFGRNIFNTRNLTFEPVSYTHLRRGASKCIIEARFDIAAYGMRPFFEENELEYDEECILRREVQDVYKRQ